ncbi:MAG: hypothetical protein C4524_02625 [Candidatus Zixiibacteriota bacterium]|nr:MAG: hypothetical protein C4524_02625 [candidate division Zixibacteria bacterium]
MATPAPWRRIFLIFVTAYLAYAAWFIFRTSFVMDGQRYFCLFDDAMISLTYARNLAEGHGLVWFPGAERVEGFTNPLWTLWMALLHLLPVSATKISLLVQATSAGLLTLNLLFVKRVADLLSGGRWVWIPAVLLTAFYLPLNHWALQGMEVGLLATLASGSAWLALRTRKEKRFFPGLYVLLGLALLTRMDAAVLFLAVWGWLLWADPARRRKHLVWGVSLFVGLMAAMTVFRLGYYGDPLPNTYYLKMTGVPLGLRLARGFQAFWSMIRQTWGVLFILPMALPFLRRDRLGWLIPGLVAAQMAYSVWVGGDAWEDWGLTNRYVTVVMPLFLILLSLVLARGAEWVAARLAAGRISRAAVRGNLLLALALLAVNLNGIRQPHLSLREWLLIKPPLAVQENREMVELARLAGDITTPEAAIGLSWAGIIPYFSRRPAVDFLGKNDRHIARLPARLPAGGDLLTGLRPGHTKWDYDYSIRTLQPDLVLQTYGLNRPEAEAYFHPDYEKRIIAGYSFQVLKGSPRIAWEEVDRRAQAFQEAW